MDIHELTLSGTGDGWYLYLREDRQGETERIAIEPSPGDHDIIRHGELVGEDAYDAE